MSTLLIISPEHWSSHTVSKHHYALVLAQSGHQVLFAGPPEQGLGSIRIESLTGADHIRVVRTPRVAPGLRWLPRFARRFLESSWLRQVESLAATRIDTVWLFENSRFYDMSFAGDRLKIYHQVDLNQDFQPEVAAASADICLCTTDFISQRLARVRPDVHKIHHGTAVSRSPSCSLDTTPYDKPGIHVSYIGNLDISYLDIDAFARITSRHPGVNFHFIGGFSEQGPLRQACRYVFNIHWWGQVPHDQVAHLIARSDVLLVAYKSAEFKEQLASPHKFMEYFLSGKVIVCSYTDEYKNKRQLVEMAEPDGSVANVFARVVQDLPRYNSPDRQAERRSFALDNSYQNQLRRIEDIVLQTTGRNL